MAQKRRTRGKSPVEPTALIHPDALQKLRDAAESVELTLEQLVNLVADSGLLALPPSDGVTQVFTLEDLGKHLWATMQGVPRSKRQAWFEGLVPVQQTAVLVVLREQGYSCETIGRELGVEAKEVKRTYDVHAGELGAQVVGMRLEMIAGSMQIASERAQEMAMRAGDHATFWRVEKERLGLLQSLGIVERAAHRLDVHHSGTVEHQVEHELEKMLELREKMAVRGEELKRIEANVLDVPPEFGELDFPEAE